VCELDILCNADKVHFILEEMVSSSGHVVNTNKSSIIDCVKASSSDGSDSFF
jgi:Clathrin adaptor complex small chain